MYIIPGTTDCCIRIKPFFAPTTHRHSACQVQEGKSPPQMEREDGTWNGTMNGTMGAYQYN